MQKFVSRMTYHTRRFNGDITIAVIILAAISLLMATAFPDSPDAIASYSEILTEAGIADIFTLIDSSAPAWLFWLSLMMGIYMFYVMAIVGIRIGARIVPTREDDALELLFASSPQSKRTTFTETYLSGIVSLLVILLPSYLLLIIVSIMKNGADTIGRLGIVFLFYFVIGVGLMTFSAFFAILRFNKSSGEKFGFLYLVLAFFIELGASSPDVSEEQLNLSIHHAMAPTSGLLTNEWEWGAFGVVLLLTLLLFAGTWWRVKNIEYIEKVKPVKTRNIRFLPNYSAKGKLARRYPIFFDQLRADRGLFYIWTPIIMFFIFYITYLYNAVYGNDPAELAKMITSFDTPLFDAFTHGEALRYDYIGFMGFEFYGLMWAYYGLFLLFPSISAANRDYRRNSQDIIWTNPVTPRQVVNSRMLAIQVQFFLMYSICTAFLFVMQAALDLPGNTQTQLLAYIVGIVYFIGLNWLLQGISMLFNLNKGRKIAMWVFLLSILTLMAGFLIKTISFVRYLSIFYYYNAVGIVFGEISFGVEFLIASSFTVLSAITYYFGLQRFERTNLC